MVILRGKFSQFSSVQLPYVLELFDGGIRQKGMHSQLSKLRQPGGLRDCVGVGKG